MDHNKTITIATDKFVFGGQALGTHNNKVILVWNALPAETAEVSIIKKKKSYCEAIATTIVHPSQYRIAPTEDHYLSCSPWQILAWDYENYCKKEIAREIYSHIGHIDTTNDFAIVSDGTMQYGYRNKIEYSFTNNKNNFLSLAFYKRGTHIRIPIDRCLLANTSINNTARSLLSWLQKHKFPERSLKSLIVRSNDSNETIVALYVKDKISLIKKPLLIENIKGFSLYFSNPRCPASRPDELLFQNGNTSISSTLHGSVLSFGALSFFQINTPLFKKVLEDITPYLDKNKPLIDFYSGVGAISIPLSRYCKNCIMIENNEESIFFAKKNIRQNNVSHYEIVGISTEKALDVIKHNAIILFDPPRSGLHKKIIKQLLSVRPIRIIYLSCNISTQARDIQLLKDSYTVTFMRLYNFFPRTPHIEGLCILDNNR